MIKHLLGSLKAQTGSVRVFGLDPVLDPVGVLGRVGYLSERRDLPAGCGWTSSCAIPRPFIRGGMSNMPGLLDSSNWTRPRNQDPIARSAGQDRVLTALAYRPDLLILDEPSSGLDPVVRRDILEAIVRMVAEEGRTVLFSSHLLDEVERVADHVVMLQRGRVVLNGRTEEVRGGHILAVLAFAKPPGRPRLWPGRMRLRVTVRNGGCCSGARVWNWKRRRP